MGRELAATLDSLAIEAMRLLSGDNDFGFAKRSERPAADRRFFFDLE